MAYRLITSIQYPIIIYYYHFTFFFFLLLSTVQKIAILTVIMDKGNSNSTYPLVRCPWTDLSSYTTVGSWGTSLAFQNSSDNYYRRRVISKTFPQPISTPWQANWLQAFQHGVQQLITISVHKLLLLHIQVEDVQRLDMTRS